MKLIGDIVSDARLSIFARARGSVRPRVDIPARSVLDLLVGPVPEATSGLRLTLNESLFMVPTTNRLFLGDFSHSLSLLTSLNYSAGGERGASTCPSC